MSKPFKKIYSQDQNLMRVQSAVAEVLDPLTQQPLLGAILLQNVTINASPTAIEHGLNRQPLGFIIVNKNISADVWQSPSIAPAKIIMLQAATAGTFSLLIF